MKKLLVVACAALFAFALSGCASNSSSGTSASAASGSSTAAASSAAGSATSGSSSAESVGIANPRSDADSAEAAAQGAGVGSFELAENLGMADKTLFDPTYRYMDDVAEATLQGGAFDVTVRKSMHQSGQMLSGDYNNYPEFWTTTIDGIEVSCHGYEAGVATAFEWCDDANYSVTFRGLGGENMGVDEAEVAAIIQNVK